MKAFGFVLPCLLASCATAAASPAPSFPKCPEQRYAEPVGSTVPMFIRFEDGAPNIEVDAICIWMDEGGTLLRGVRSNAVTTQAGIDVPVRLLPGKHRLRLRVRGHEDEHPAVRIDLVSSHVVDARDSLAAVTVRLRDRGGAKAGVSVLWSEAMQSP